MHALRQLILEYQADLKENRLSYSDAQLQQLKEELKVAYQNLKEEDATLHKDTEFMHAYKSMHGLIQQELRERMQDKGLTIDQILADRQTSKFRDHVLKRAERQLRQGDCSHTPQEYLTLCDIVTTPDHGDYSSTAISALRAHQGKGLPEKAAHFKTYVEQKYTPSYQAFIAPYAQVPIDERAIHYQLPVAEQLKALEQLVDNAETTHETYNAETILHQWTSTEASTRLLAEDFSGQNRITLKKIKEKIAAKKTRNYPPSKGEVFQYPFKRRESPPLRLNLDQVAGYGVAAAVVVGVVSSLVSN